MPDPFEDYWHRDHPDDWTLVRQKKVWVPDFLWAFVADLHGLGWHWPAEALSEVPDAEA